MKIINDYKRICRNLDQCKKECYCNPIVCARKYLKSYVNNDRDLLLKIKVEANAYDSAVKFEDNQLNILMCLIAAGSLALNMEKEMGHIEIVIIEIQISLIIILVLMTVALEKVRHEQWWKKYILVAIEELEKEIF